MCICVMSRGVSTCSCMVCGRVVCMDTCAWLCGGMWCVYVHMGCAHVCGDVFVCSCVACVWSLHMCKWICRVCVQCACGRCVWYACHVRVCVVHVHMCMDVVCAYVCSACTHVLPGCAHMHVWYAHVCMDVCGVCTCVVSGRVHVFAWICGVCALMCTCMCGCVWCLVVCTFACTCGVCVCYLRLQCETRLALWSVVRNFGSHQQGRALPRPSGRTGGHGFLQYWGTVDARRALPVPCAFDPCSLRESGRVGDN